MVTPLKYDTASQEIMLGPFVDSTDGNTEETGLTINSVNIWLWKQGATAMVNPLTGATHMNNGMYYFVAGTTDSDTLGALKVYVHVSGALPVVSHCCVYPANIYNTLIADSDAFDVNVESIDNIDFGATMKTSLETAVDNGMDNAIGGAPTAGSIAERIKTLDDAYTATRAAYLDELAAANLPTDIANVKAETATILADTNELQTDWVNGGRLDLILDAILLDTGTTLQNDITAIKAITDLLVLADIADTIWDEVMDAGAPANCNSGREYMNLIAAVVGGKSSGGGTATIVFRDLGDTKDRQSATVTADGNRTAVVVDGT